MLESKETRMFGMLLFFFIVMLGFFFGDIGLLKDARMEILGWVSVMIAAAFAVPFIRLVERSVKLINREIGIERYLQMWALLVALITIISGVIPPLADNPTFTWIYLNIYLTCSVTYGALVAFTFLSAAYRSLKVKSWISLVIVGSAMIMMLANAPVGSAIWSGFPDLGNWILNIETAGVFRGLLLTLSLGMLGLMIRTLMGIERMGE